MQSFNFSTMRKPKQIKKDWFSCMLDDDKKYAIPIGPRFQAEVPEWTGPPQRKYPHKTLESSKWLGTVIWSNKDTLTREIEMDVIGQGRPHHCDCYIPGSILCVNRHITEKTTRLQKDLGPAFQIWKFDEMGEVAAKLWKQSEQQKFERVVKMSPISEESAFDLEDLSGFLSIKKEKSNPVAPKARIMHICSSKVSKKRKGVEPINLVDVPDLPVTDLIQMAILKVASDKKAFDKQIEDLEDQKKIVAANASFFEKEAQKLKKQVKDIEATHKLKIKKNVEGTKKSAAVAILRAQIQMAEKAKKEGADLWVKELSEWAKILTNLIEDVAKASDVAAAKTTSVAGTCKAGEGEDIGAGAGAGAVTMGDEDRDDKV
ncbi:hypothetical protein R6Q59_036554 [Mikania micrantha]